MAMLSNQRVSMLVIYIYFYIWVRYYDHHSGCWYILYLLVVSPRRNNNFYQQGSWWTASSVAQKRPAPVRNAQRHWVWPTLTSKVCNTNTSMQLKAEAVPFWFWMKKTAGEKGILSVFKGCLSWSSFLPTFCCGKQKQLYWSTPGLICITTQIRVTPSSAVELQHSPSIFWGVKVRPWPEATPMDASHDIFFHLFASG